MMMGNQKPSKTQKRLEEVEATLVFKESMLAQGSVVLENQISCQRENDRMAKILNTLIDDGAINKEG